MICFDLQNNLKWLHSDKQYWRTGSLMSMGFNWPHFVKAFIHSDKGSPDLSSTRTMPCQGQSSRCESLGSVRPAILL